MDGNMALFLSVSTFCGVMLVVVVAALAHIRKMKELEVEKYKAQKANLREEIDSALEKRFSDHAKRIEVLEAIVTDKNYDLSDKITRLK